MSEPTDAERYPTLSESGRAMLLRMTEHPAAPTYRNRSGNRLLPADLEALAMFEAEMLTAPIGWRPGIPPAWIGAFLEQTYREVPHFRARGNAPSRLDDIATTSRADLARDIAAFVPDTVATDRLINFRTTGTTGHPLLIASHPRVAASYLTFHKRALARFGITLRAGSGDVGVVLLGHQQRCFTYVSVTPTMGEAGLAKINLHPNDWREADDRARYLDALAPEVVAGDPISFASLLELPVTMRPRAILSVAMMLTDGMRDRLEARFGCPVLDLYSMNEVGPIAVTDRALGGRVLLQPRLYVEIVDDAGHALPPGSRGEVCVTGGFNFCLPLVRYRTGDTAVLDMAGDVPMLRDFSGRRAVRFRTAAGAWVNNIDLSHALQRLSGAQFAIHQDSDGAISLALSADASDEAGIAEAALRRVLGDVPISVTTIVSEDKLLQYTSDLPGSLAA
ncbi:AMP-binding protein [Sphingomonas sp.]|uniref:AMP-binding protein n=1 Tax=Sphingomonas sp. TaxID=28214 RepID=UPI003B3A409F